MKKKCLFLGYKNKQTKLIKFLRQNNFEVSNTSKTITFKQIKKYNLIISFGYKKIINSEIINKLKRPIINLHIGYLPFNRGFHPNLWSFLDNTPSGVTIHEIDKGLDTGPIIFQKKVSFKPNVSNFIQTYKILRDEIEKLFILNFKKLVNGKYRRIKQRGIHTFHKENEKPNFIKWSMKIEKAKKKYDKYLKADIKKNLSLIDAIQDVRKNNNVNWMDILRLGMIKSPKDAKNLIKKISSDDDEIGSLLRKIG
tara:strand:+ start:932 stop:1690 length:759 start_codon:yes stop_codon:yes gene_type:complete